MSPSRFTVFLGHGDISQIHQVPKLSELGRRKVAKVDGYYRRPYCILAKGRICRTIDVAILTLDQAVDFTQSIRPLCLPEMPGLHYYLQDSVVAGWGCTRLPLEYRDKLGKAEQIVEQNEDCKRLWVETGRELGKSERLINPFIPNPE